MSVLQEIPTDFNFASNTVDTEVSFDEKVRERPLRSSRKGCRSHSLKLGQTLSPKLEETTNISGVVELFSSPVNVSSKQRIASITSGDTEHTSTSRSSSGMSVHHLTPDSSRVQIAISSGKKTPKHNVHQSLLKKSSQSKSLLGSEDTKNSEIYQSCPSIPRVGRKSTRTSRSSPGTSDNTNQMSSSGKSGIFSVKQTPKYGSHCSGTRKSPKLEQEASSVTPSSISVSKQITSRRNSRSSVTVMQSPKSVESASRLSAETRGKAISVSQCTPSVWKSRSSAVIRSAESYDSDSRSSPRTGDRGKSISTSSPASARKLKCLRVAVQSPKAVGSGSSAEAGGTGNSVSSCTPTYKQGASARNKGDTSSTILSPEAVDESSTSAGLRMFSLSPARRGRKAMPISDSSLSMQLSANAVRNVSSKLDEEGHRSSGSGFLKSSEKHVHRLSRSDTSVNSVSTLNSTESCVNEALLPTPDSHNTTFDFDSMKTPHIPVEDFVSPLSSRKRSFRLQVAGNVHGIQQLMKMSPKVSLSRVHGFAMNSGMLKSPTNDLSDVSGVRRLMKTPRSTKSPKNDLSDVCGVRQLMKTPRSQKSPKNDLSNVCGVKQLMKTPKRPKAPKNDLSDVCGVRQLMKSPRSPKSPRNDLSDVRGVKQLMKTPKSLKSPKNDLSDVRGVRQLMKTPRSPKSPKNDLSDVCGVKRLMKSPKTVNSPLNDLTDVRGVRRLMTTPRVNKSPKNDLSDVHGVKELMETPGSPSAATDNVTYIDHQQLGKTVTTHHLVFDDDVISWAQSKPESESSPVSEEMPSMATRKFHRQESRNTTPIKHSPKFVKTEVHEAEKSGTEVFAGQKTVHSPEEIKVNYCSLILSSMHCVIFTRM
jgi:hypothetical protein